MKLLKTLALEQKETTRHGEAVFPLQKYITQLDSDHPVVTTHWHDEAEFTLVTDGEAEYQIDLQACPVRPGDLLFIHPRVLHTIALAGTKSYRSETYVFHLNYLGVNAADICATRYLRPLMNEELSLPCHIGPTHPAHSALRKIFDRISLMYGSTPPGYELAVKSCLLEAIVTLLPYSVSGKIQNTDSASGKLKTVLDYIHLHYTEPLTVKDLADRCYFSEYYFMRFFKKHMHMTVIGYLNNLRMEKAVELFEQGQTSILEVSMSVGFHSLSYFHKVFREKFSMTPKEFLRQL